jgi:uncharacterized membrane protein YdbT with pleckstrin-like domain
MKPSWFYYAAKILILGVLVLLGAIGLAQRAQEDVGIAPVLMVVGACALFFLIRLILSRNCTHYTVTSHKLIQKWGILSKSTREIPVQNLQAVKLDKSLVERLFRLGTLRFSTASAREDEVMFAGVRDPEGIKGRIDAIHREFFMR